MRMLMRPIVRLKRRNENVKPTRSFVIEQWRVSYGTSSIFRYCPYCGSFINGDGDCSCFGVEGGYMIVSDAEVAEAVDMAYADPDNYKVTLGTYED